ncbi:hypothetical protein [Roseicyclus sp.]|uniref:hypothetical protein n=1 Tax=Roseicyclus sp. TaxID=1914329 RepID=UPI003F6BA3C0
MATQTYNSPIFVPRIAGSVTAFFANVAHAFAMATGAQARFDEIQRLQALSDDDLARIGLSRDDIVRHVYADLLTR